MYNSALLKAIIGNAIDGIIVIDHAGYIISANPSACILFGYSANELCGENISKLMVSPDKEHHDEYLQRYKDTRQPHIIGLGREIIGLKKNGSVFPARLAVGEVEYKDGHVYAGIVHDISIQKEAEQKLRQYNNELELAVEERTRSLKSVVEKLERTKEEVNISLLKEKEINQLKTRFVSMASHEFRTPLSSIQLSASLLERYYDHLNKQKIFTHLEKIKSAVVNLTEVLNDFLSVERIEAGKIKPINTEFDLDMLCLDIIEAMKMQTGEFQKINYKHIGKTTRLNLDSNMLQHCLVNLVSNAIKYSREDGYIELKTKITKEECSIFIKDEGIGIPKEDQAHLYETFFRASNTGDIGGTGLGLNIVKRYTELMNGRIDFESNENKGTLVKLTFPVNIGRTITSPALA
jgi:two-component system sensor kinase FixL